jgi:F-type H+-transporting ATPase subunit gamma
MKATVSLIDKEYKTKNVTILPLGKKAFEYFTRRSYTTKTDFYEIFADVKYDEVREIAEYAMNGFLSKKFDKVVLVYNHFRNVATQDIQVEQFLPMGGVKDLTTKEKPSSTDYILEPSKEYVIRDLVPTALKTQFYKAVLDSNASEHGARMTSMDKATENANELLKELKLMYNRNRQAAITNEILEIVAGANALEGS